LLIRGNTRKGSRFHARSPLISIYTFLV
jgi:hypothetical protein